MLPSHIAASKSSALPEESAQYHCSQNNFAFSNMEYKRNMTCLLDDSIPGKRFGNWSYDESEATCHGWKSKDKTTSS
jgi:hypothetical protein